MGRIHGGAGWRVVLVLGLDGKADGQVRWWKFVAKAVPFLWPKVGGLA